MSYDLYLFKGDKSCISKKEIENFLWKQNWIMRLPQSNTYALYHIKDKAYIEISHVKQYYENPFAGEEEIDSIELNTWASSSEWTFNHLLRLADNLAETLELIIYDPQLGQVIKPQDYDKMEESYFYWRQTVEAFSLKLELNENKSLLPIIVFVGHSFLPKDDFVSDYIITGLRNRVKEVVTGRPAQNKSISKKVKEKIDKSNLVVFIFTRRKQINENIWETSSWLINEAVYALGKGKTVIIVKEDGVTNLPGIFGDLEFVPLNRRELMNSLKIIEEMIKDYMNS